MEEENYNAIGGGSEELEYPTMDEQREDNDNPVLAQLNEMSRRSCKRRYEELENLPPDEVYTHPIDWHMRMPLTLEEREAKRQKQLEEEIIVERVTTKIIDARMRKRTEKHGDDMIVDDLELETRNKVMRIPPIDGTPWMGVSTDDNDHRYYIRLLRNSQKTSDAILKKRNTVLFTERMFPNIIEDSEKVRKIMLERLTDSEHTIFPTTSDGLWVDNYSPKSFVDLLSDDEINRNVLTWLKLWDECVFRKKISNEDMDTLVMEKDKEIFALDSGKIRRPTHKVLLLSGPAGLGKTTLAKIIAHHAGYDTVEVNASDSRNVADFERVIEGALRSTKTIDGTVGGGGRPNCLILDEIDGAPAETIRYLVRTLQVVGKKCIRRPIICICNNMFTPSLRELRNKNVALSIPLSQPKQDRMVDRLMKITEKENVRIDRGTLIKLVELCNRDVRCSINIMQFVAVAARKEQRVVGLREIQEAVTKQSLGSTNIFESWSAFLDLNKHLDSKGIQVKCSDRVRAIERIMYECGDERFVTGLHANFVRLSLPIGVLRKASECFVFYDKISITIGHLQNYVLNRYMLSFYAMFHLTVATHSRIAIKYPHYEQEVQQRLRQSQETISAVRSKSMAKFTPFELISDILPLIGVIVQPPLKPMNEHLYSKREIAQIQSTVSILYWYNLTFVATVVGSQVHYTFQPPIDVLTLYDLSDVNGRQSMPSSTRYMLAKKVEVYRVQANQGGAITSTEVTTNTEKIKSLIANSKSIGGSRVVPLHFKYNQGVSTAVKRNIRMSNLLCF